MVTANQNPVDVAVEYIEEALGSDAESCETLAYIKTHRTEAGIMRTAMEFIDECCGDDDSETVRWLRSHAV